MKIFIQISVWLVCMTTNLAAQYTEPSIILVTLNNNNEAIITFMGSDHPDIDHYFIREWRITSLGTQPSNVPIYSVPIPNLGEVQHTSPPIALPNNGTESVGFTVGGYDASDQNVGNGSIPADSTMSVSTSGYDSCLAQITLNWNDYYSWRGNIDYYEVIAESESSGMQYTSPPLPEGTQSYIFSNLPVNDLYKVYVTAKAANLSVNDVTRSNGIPFNTYHARHPEFIYANHGTVNSNNSPEVMFTFDAFAEINTFELLRSSTSTGSFESITILNAAPPYIHYTDENVDASAQPYYYQLAVRNCNMTGNASENLAQTIHLVSSNSGYTVNLNWNEYEQWPAGVQEYSIERSLNRGTYQGIANASTPYFQDDELHDLAGAGINNEVCYRITANESVATPHSLTPSSSTSNISCVTLPINIEFYDAFIPGNPDYNGFEPKFDFLPTFYDFKIFNRTGSVVYHSKDIQNTRWDGRGANGSFVPQGIYRYTLLYNDENNARQAIKGSLTVIREQ